MRLCTLAFLSVLTGACGLQPGDGLHAPASSASAMKAAFAEQPRPDPTPLPPPHPSSKTQSEIEAMGDAVLAQWIFPREARKVSTVEMLPPRWGVVTYAYFWTAPRPAHASGICMVEGRGVSFRIADESRLTDQQRLDPPLTPFQTVPERRFRAAESGGDACRADGPYWQWSIAPSADALHRAANLVRQAQVAIKQSGTPSFRLMCSAMPPAEGEEPGSSPCRAPQTLLQRLTPGLIKRVSGSNCEGEIERLTPDGACLTVEYHDPDAPGTYAFYLVRIEGTSSPRTIEIIEGMMPPH